MSKEKEFAEHTYNDIVFENSHILIGDLDAIKNKILTRVKLIPNNYDKTMFILNLKAKIKNEKIDNITRQEREIGMIIMSGYEKFIDIFNWLDDMEFKTNLSEKKKASLKICWNYGDDDLKKLSAYLKKENLIENQEVFIKLFLDIKDCGQVNWKGDNTLLIYLVGKLKANGIINKTILQNKFVETHFLNNLEPIKYIKQTKGNFGNNQSGKPFNYSKIDTIIEDIKATGIKL